MDEKASKVRQCLIVLRVSILVTVLAHIYLHFFWLFYDAPVSGEEASLWRYQGQGSIYEVPSSFLWLYIMFWYIALAGMFIQINWARWFYLVILFLGFVVTYISGMQVATPSEAIAIDLISVLSGLIVAIVFLSPLEKTFLGEAINSD